MTIAAWVIGGAAKGMRVASEGCRLNRVYSAARWTFAYRNDALLLQAPVRAVGIRRRPSSRSSPRASSRTCRMGGGTVAVVVSLRSKVAAHICVSRTAQFTQRNGDRLVHPLRFLLETAY